MNGPFCLVVNPAAGGGRASRVLPAATAALGEAGAAYQVSRSASLDHARELFGGHVELHQHLAARERLLQPLHVSLASSVERSLSPRPESPRTTLTGRRG